jgi:hypothetical protein
MQHNSHHKWFFLAAGVALGVAIGFPSGSQKAKSSTLEAAEAAAKSSTSRSATSSLVAEADKSKAARLEHLRTMVNLDPYKGGREFAETIKASDVPDLLEVFLQEAGLEGIEYEQKKLLEKAVALWVAEDVDAALLWAGNLSTLKLQQFFQSMMLRDLAKTDPFRALELASELQSQDKDFPFTRVLSAGIDALMKQPGKEREIAEMMRLAPSKDGGSSGSGQDFPEGFSFETLLNSMAAMKKEGFEFSYTPTGMLKSWAKLDPEAAHAWWIANGEVGFEEWSDVYTSVADSMGHEDSARWLLEKFTEGNQAQRQTMARALNEVYPAPAARMVAAENMAKQLPPDLANEFVDHVLQDHFSSNRKEQVDGLSMLNWYPTPQARADVLAKHLRHYEIDEIFENIPEAQLAPYGVTRQELEAAFQRR